MRRNLLNQNLVFSGYGVVGQHACFGSKRIREFESHYPDKRIDGMYSLIG